MGNSGAKQVSPQLAEARKATQFKPGVSGNPAGKPKGTKHINTWIQELLEDENFETVITDAKKGIVDYKGAPIKAILGAQMHLALHSRDEAVRIKATDLLLKHGWSQKQDIKHEGEITHKYEDMDDDQLQAIIKAREDRISGIA
jgi:hypothetical protein